MYTAKYTFLSTLTGAQNTVFPFLEPIAPYPLKTAQVSVVSCAGHTTLAFTYT